MDPITKYNDDYKQRQRERIVELESENAEMMYALQFIAGQKDKTENWAVELAKNTLTRIGR